MHGRRSKKISILIVPEDNAEPYSLRFDARWVKVAYVIGGLLLVHMIVGAFFYWKYAQQYAYTQELLSLNAQLEEDNKQVIALAEQFAELDRNYRRVTRLLGIRSEANRETNGLAHANEVSQPLDGILAVNGTEADARLEFLSAEKPVFSFRQSKIENHAENIPTLLPVEGFVTLDFKKDAWFMPNAHMGIDIVAKKGSIVRAAASGVIIFADWTFDLGNLIIVDHGGGILSYYGHNQRILKPEKSYVKKGEPIALLGSSGNSSGPHLHFEIWKDGTPVDPKEFIVGLQDQTRSATTASD